MGVVEEVGPGVQHAKVGDREEDTGCPRCEAAGGPEHLVERS